MPDKKRLVRVHPSALHREVQGEIVLLHLDSGEYFGLNDVGSRIWQLIVDTGNLDEVEATILREFDVDPDVLSRDLQAVVDQLVEKNLIELV